MTAPSSPLLTSPFPSVNATSLASIANVTIRPTSSHGTPLPPTQPLEYNAYGIHHVRISTPPPISAFSSLPRAQPQAVLPIMGTVSEHQLLARFPSGLSVDDPVNMITKYESPPANNRDLPTPPSSSAGVHSVKGSRVSSPPIQLPQPKHALSQPSLKQAPPPMQPHAKSAPLPLKLSSPPAPVQPASHYSTHGSVSSSSQREPPPPPDQTSRQRAQTHPAHPGPISLPPAAFVIPAPHNFSPVSPMFSPPGILVPSLHRPGVPPLTASHAPAHSPLTHPIHSHVRSPLHHPVHGHPINMTPSGLPPITPSMPSFQFVSGPPPPTHLGHPPAIFPPGSTMSPGAFWGRPGGNPLTNAAVGAPVTKGTNGEEIDYFASAATADSDGEGYFPPLPQAGSSLANEIMRDEPESASGSDERQSTLGPAIENGPDREEVSSNSGSSGQSSANKRIGGTSIDGVIERFHGGMHISLAGPEGIPRSEEQQQHGRGHRDFSLPPLRPPPTRRKVLDPMQEQGTRNHILGIAELVQDAGSRSN